MRSRSDRRPELPLAEIERLLRHSQEPRDSRLIAEARECFFLISSGRRPAPWLMRSLEEARRRAEEVRERAAGLDADDASAQSTS